ncbi:hypothetical protein KG088_07955 [Halomonas sp. TRM85114]|nr:hypothetical protein [Halomonas jincaotanensis]MBS9403560.1 hypothetical protein [Halomonas jincaotanensis]
MTSSPTQAPESTRDRLHHAASTLFYSHGITATGVDTTVRRAAPLDMS